MTLPASVPVGFHANVPEISALQDAVNAILSATRTELDVFDLAVANSLIVEVTLQVNGNAEVGELMVDGSLLAGNVQLSQGINVGTPAGINQSGRISQGSGVPSNTVGANGDAYFRTDTPGTANQRLYFKVAGAWTGVL